ncbi:MAG: acyl-CoA thioesterase [Saprospiraceae bacterium]|nr:acyl-CoA thioesterase [Saprospiraceae bacterium]
MFEHSTKVRVRYGETDQMGVVYYGNYALYYEVGRVEAIRSLGFSYNDLEKQLKVVMPVLEVNIKYLRPAYYDNLLTVRTTLTELPTKIITYHSEIINEENTIINTSSIKLCFLDAATRKMINIPDLLVNLLQPFFT